MREEPSPWDASWLVKLSRRGDKGGAGGGGKVSGLHCGGGRGVAWAGGRSGVAWLGIILWVVEAPTPKHHRRATGAIAWLGPVEVRQRL